MKLLKGFRTQSFIEKMCVLNEMEKGKKFQAIPELFELLATPLKDAAADIMVIHTLRALLSLNEEETLQGLQSESSSIRKLCANVAGENNFQSAGAVLLGMASREKDPDTLFEVLSAMSKIKAPEFLQVFRNFHNHPGHAIAALSIEMLGVYKDLDSFELLRGIIEEGEAEDLYERCDLAAGKAIEALGAIGSAGALSFFVSKIHHRNPTARRIIHDELAKKGAEAVHCLAAVFEGKDVDAKILAANVIGLIGDKKGGDVLINALDQGKADHPNIKYAIYEALGRIPFLKGIVCLVDALSEEDHLLLLAVITSLNDQLNPGVVKKLSEAIKEKSGQSNRITGAIVSARALNIFEALIGEEEVSDKLTDRIARSADAEAVSAFLGRLQLLQGDAAKAAFQRLSSISHGEAGKKILAVDDSRAMLHFYRSAASELGLDVATAINGKEAWDLLKKGKEFDLIITDMNMPVMDGIELVRKIRGNSPLKRIPVIMATTESEKSQVEMAARAGVDDFLTKPFNQGDFQEKIKNFL